LRRTDGRGPPRWVGPIAVVAWLSACGPALQLNRPTIDHWLLCEECEAGELDSVVALQSAAVPTLQSTIRGPEPERVQNVRVQLVASYAHVVAQLGASTPLSEAEYVQHYLQTYVATYQTRSAIALGRIGTPAAVAALRDAANDSTYSEDVLQELARALVDTIVKVEGDLQTTRVGARLPIDPAVMVLDGLGSPVPQVLVRFTPDSGSGSVSRDVTPTDVQSGRASTIWTLGPTPGPQRLRVTAGNVTAEFRATANSTQARVLTANLGQWQSAPVGTAVPVRPSVLVTDGGGGAVPGAPVTFDVTRGGGSAPAGPQLADASGVATVESWILGPGVGDTNDLAARSTGSPDTVVFHAVATPIRPSSMSRAEGNNQSATVGTAVPVRPSVIVRDGSGNPLPGVAVLFAVIEGGGDVLGEIQTTTATGIATVTAWVLGPAPGRNRLWATTRNLPGIVLEATGVP